jgi:hypothetical protein
MLIWEWPNRSWTTLGCTPAESKSVADVQRIPWKRIAALRRCRFFDNVRMRAHPLFTSEPRCNLRILKTGVAKDA